MTQMQIRICELSDVLPQLPEASALDAAADVRQDDLYIVALGFEDRCLSILQYLAASTYHASQAIYLSYATNVDDNAANRPRLEKLLQSISDSQTSLASSDPDFIHNFRNLIAAGALSVGARKLKVTFDISVVANRVLLRCLDILFVADIDLRIVYAEAAIYHPTKQEYEDDKEGWVSGTVFGLERGVSNVEPSCEHPGCHLDRLPDCLVLFPCFHAARTKAVIASVDPTLLSNPADRLVWVVGIPHLEEDRWRSDLMSGVNGIRNETTSYAISTFEYKQTVSVLETIYRSRWDQFNITVSPLGSKMQAVGTAMFLRLHPDVRVIVATPKEYNAVRYSEGHKAFWQVELGETESLLGKLREVGRISLA